MPPTPTLEEFKGERITKPHEAFTVEIDVARFYDWEPLNGKKAPKGAEVIETQTGPSVRVVRDYPSTSVIRFTAGGIDEIMAERDYAREHGEPPATHLAKLSFNQVVANHIQDAAMALHAPQEDWRDVRCSERPDLAKYLKAVFELPRPTSKKKGDA